MSYTLDYIVSYTGLYTGYTLHYTLNYTFDYIVSYTGLYTGYTLNYIVDYTLIIHWYLSVYTGLFNVIYTGYNVFYICISSYTASHLYTIIYHIIQWWSPLFWRACKYWKCHVVISQRTAWKPYHLQIVKICISDFGLPSSVYHCIRYTHYTCDV